MALYKEVSPNYILQFSLVIFNVPTNPRPIALPDGYIESAPEFPE